VKETIYFVVSKKGVKNTLIYKNPPPVKPGELWVKLNLNLHDTAFEVPPIEGTLTLTEDQVRHKIIEGLELELKQLKEKD